jgi:hypothetical protein
MRILATHRRAQLETAAAIANRNMFCQALQGFGRFFFAQPNGHRPTSQGRPAKPFEATKNCTFSVASNHEIFTAFLHNRNIVTIDIHSLKPLQTFLNQEHISLFPTIISV